MNDETLRRLYRDGLERHRPPNRAACVSPEQVLALAAGELSPAEAAAAADHAMACARCREEYALVVAILQSRPAAGRRRTRVLALAASVVLVAGAALIWRTQGTWDAAQPRGGAEQVQLLEPVARGGAPWTLAWRGVAGARYTVEILDSAGAALHSSTTRDTSLVIPETVRLAPGARYQWWVRAMLPDGREIPSLVDTFRVR